MAMVVFNQSTLIDPCETNNNEILKE